PCKILDLLSGGDVERMVLRISRITQPSSEIQGIADELARSNRASDQASVEKPTRECRSARRNLDSWIVVPGRSGRERRDRAKVGANGHGTGIGRLSGPHVFACQ